MRSFKLYELAATSVFSSKGLATALHKDLLSRFGNFEKSSYNYKDSLHALIHDFDMASASKTRLEDLTGIFSSIWSPTMFLDREIPLLDDLFDRGFLILPDGQVRIKPDNLVRFSNLCARIDPAVVVGWGIAKSYTLKKIDLDQVLGAALCSHEKMYFNSNNEQSSLAENHVHLGGAYGVDLSFVSAIFSNSPRGILSDELSSLRRWLIELLSLSDPTNKTLSENILKKEFSGRWATEIPLPPDWKGWEITPIPVGNSSVFSEVRKFIAEAWNCGNADRAWLGMLFWLSLCYLRTPSRWIRVAIFLAISVMMSERSDVIGGESLTRFIKGFHKSSRKHSSIELQNLASARRIFGNKLDVAEVKIAFHGISDVIPQLTKAISDLQLEGTEDNSSRHLDTSKIADSLNLAVTRWHCCLHFFRIEEYKINPRLIIEEAREIGRNLAFRPNWNLPEILDEIDFPWANSRIGDWVRGIDVAGNENLVRIEYFAPALRLLRDVFFNQNESGSSYSPIHLSLHAGEDFSDIASGLRHIDESVQFCNMKKGDRLGHALALGILPETWGSDKDCIILPLDEHIDNLIWTWKRSEQLGIQGFNEVRTVLSERVMILFFQLPWISDYKGELLSALSTEDLYQEWKLRRNSYDYWLTLSLAGQTGQLDESSLVPDKDILNIEQHLPSILFNMRAKWLRSCNVKNFERDKIGLTQRMPNVNISFSDAGAAVKCEVQINGWIKGFIEDEYHPRNLALLHAIQDLLYTEYCRMEIQIEVNPTSNVYIGDFKDYTDHPIFRWTLPHNLAESLDGIAINEQAELILLTINTDDPGVMPTNLRLEFALIREAAISLGWGAERVDRWIEKLVQAGLKEFHDKHHGVKKFPASQSTIFSLRN